MTSDEEQTGTFPAQQEAPVGAAAAVPHYNPEELKQEIERTREQLGETVEALAAKADVKAQARAKMTQVTTRLKSKTAQAKQQAAAKAGAADGQRRLQLAMAASAVGLAWLAIVLWRRQ
jgi:hypothetical protein